VSDVVTAYIPSPPADGISVGPFQLHFYGLLIAVAVLVAAWLGQRRWAKLGGFPGTLVPITFWAVVSGLVGARLYSVATSWQQDTGGHPLQILEIWNGGLGIWGGVAGGVLGGWLKARQMRLTLPPLLDVVAPTLALAQAIGRWGNYFNQELFGLPSKLPWAVRITDQSELADIPAKYQTPFVSGKFLPGTFQPTFLYESIWDLATFGLLLLIERRVKLRRGYLFAAYAALYTFGRFFTEYLRIDPAHRYLGLRLNDWTSIAVFAVAAFVLLLRGRPKPGDELVGDALSAGLIGLEQERAKRSMVLTPTQRPELSGEAEAGPMAEPEPGPAAAEPEAAAAEPEAVAAEPEAVAAEPEAVAAEAEAVAEPQAAGAEAEDSAAR
jgi:prolipoprotein diacylglyceryl transferase